MSYLHFIKPQHAPSSAWSKILSMFWLISFLFDEFLTESVCQLKTGMNEWYEDKLKRKITLTPDKIDKVDSCFAYNLFNFGLGKISSDKDNPEREADMMMTSESNQTL